MAELKTGWVIIATSGATIDGRTIEKQWLTDMATHYNPKVYSCRLWPDHFRFFEPQGKVLALKVEDATEEAFKGEIHLFAILAPTEQLVNANRRGHYTHTSIEVYENFGNKGYTYLAGLAVTDMPASLGTQELKFSANSEKGTFHIPGNTLDLSESVVSEKKGVFSALFGGKDNNPQQDNDEMNDKQFEQFMAAQAKQTEALNALTEKFNSAPVKPETEADDAGTATITAEQFAEVQNQLAKITEQYTALDKKFADALNTPAPGTMADEGEGSATEESL